MAAYQGVPVLNTLTFLFDFAKKSVCFISKHQKQSTCMCTQTEIYVIRPTVIYTLLVLTFFEPLRQCRTMVFFPSSGLQ